MHYSYIEEESGHYMTYDQDRIDTAAIILSEQGLLIWSNDWPSEIWWSESGPSEITSTEQYEVAKWCEENLEGEWLIGIHTSAFVLETDFMAFILRWT